MAVATLKSDHRIENMLALARDAGCPRDQMERFIRAGYIMIDGMQPFHAWAREADKPGGPEWIGLGGKRGPGKSHAIMAQAGLDDMQRVDGLKVLFIRKIQKSAAEALEDRVRWVFLYTPHSLTQDGVKLPNGSRMVIGGYKDESDIEKYLGIEYHVICLGEATQIGEGKKDKLRGSLRSSIPGWRPRMYLDTNPDGPGLLWFKKMFVQPWREGRQTNTYFLDTNNIYNPFNNPEYDAWLDSLTGNLRKAWRDGDWDAFAGMGFPNWNHDRHVIEPFAIPDSWVKWRAVDWGYYSPFCCLWFAKEPDTKRIYVYREYYSDGLTDRDQARAIMDSTPPNEKIVIGYGDPNSFWVSKNQAGRVFTSADEYAANGVILTPADDNRILGIRRVRTLLGNLADGKPGLQVFRNCPHL